MRTIYKTCGRCGLLHDHKYTCRKGVERSKYKTSEDKLRNTYQWHATAKWVKKESNYLCAVCLDHGVYSYDGLEVHHIIKIKDDASKLLDINNLICLCRYHHMLADSGDLDKNYLFNLVKKRENSDNAPSPPIL